MVMQAQRRWWPLELIVDLDDDGADDNDDDIYIMMKCLCVCVCVTKNHHFPLPSWALEAWSEPPARPCRPKAAAVGRLWPSDDDDDNALAQVMVPNIGRPPLPAQPMLPFEGPVPVSGRKKCNHNEHGQIVKVLNPYNECKMKVPPFLSFFATRVIVC